MKSRLSSLWFRVAWPFVLFVVIGSGALAAWMQSIAEHESAAVFTALARANADFLKSARIPESEQTMSYLGRMLNMKAFLSRAPGELTPNPEPALAPLRERLASLQPREGVQPLEHGWEGIAAPLGGSARLILLRPAEPALEFLQRKDTIGVLGAFCLLSVALAGVVSRAALRAERLALLGRLATGLAHEIHNPLSTIRLHSQLLESAPEAGLALAVAQAAPVLVEESGRIEALVNQWMFLARPEPPRTRELALAEVVARVLRNHSAMARHTRVELRSTVEAERRALADERRLMQALSNLVLNGLQAMPQGGVLLVAAERSGAMTVLTVRDRGPGFSPAALAHARELFFSEKEGGMGVGLSVVGEIVEAHGGRLEFANEAGGGATVRVYLPASAAP